MDTRVKPAYDACETMTLFTKLSTAADERSARLAGIGLMLAGVCMFAFGDALGKALVARYPVNQLLLLRAAVPLGLLLALIWRQRATLPELERPGLQLLRIVLSTAEVAAFFIAVGDLSRPGGLTYYPAGARFFPPPAGRTLAGKLRRWRRGAPAL